MGLTQLKNVKWTEDERIDLDDLSALSALKDADLREYLLALLEPHANGTVFRGFKTTSSGLNWALDNTEDSLAVAQDGSFLEIPQSLAPTAALQANRTNYIHAYLIDNDSDLDNRRFLNDIPSPPEEVTTNVATRQTKTVAFYVTDTAEVTPVLGSFSTSAVISGKTRALVAIAAQKTDGVGVTSTVDFRNMWTVNGNQIPAPNGGADELPFTFSGSNGDRNLKGLRTMFRALASVIRDLGSQTTRDWWTITPTLTDLTTNVVSGSVQKRISSSKATTATVLQSGGPAGSADYTSITAAIAGISNGEIHLRRGVHSFNTSTGDIDFTGKSDLTIQGEGISTTQIQSTSQKVLIFGAGASNIVIRDVSFTYFFSGPVTEYLSFDNGANRIVFENCYFFSSLPNEGWISATGGTNIEFRNCIFTVNSFGLFGSNGVNAGITFTDCTFLPVDAASKLATAAVTTVTFDRCRFGTYGLTTWQGWNDTQADDVNATFRDCQFFALDRFATFTGGAALNVFLTFERCQFDDSLSTAGLFGVTGTPTFNAASRVRMRSCYCFRPYVVSWATAPTQLNILNFEFEDCLFESDTGPTLPMFHMSADITQRFFRWKGCRIFHGDRIAIHAQYAPTAAAGANVWNVQVEQCDFYTAWSRNAALNALNNWSVVLQITSTVGQAVLSVQVSGCHFENAHAASLPLLLTAGGVATAFGYGVFDYSWFNGTNAANSTGLSTSGSGTIQVIDTFRRQYTLQATNTYVPRL